MKKYILLLILFCVVLRASTNLKIILTAALADAHYDFRKQQYLESFAILKQLGYPNFYIVEALKKNGPTFLDEHCENVFYSTKNNPNLRNKGINEAITLLDGLHHFNFDDNDIIVKLTGRYQLLSNYFLRIIEHNEDYDVFVKYDNHGQVHTLCFGMRCKYLKELLYGLPYESMERNLINIEREVANYICNKRKEGKIKVLTLKKLDIKARMLGSSVSPNAPDEILIF